MRVDTVATPSGPKKHISPPTDSYLKVAMCSDSFSKQNINCKYFIKVILTVTKLSAGLHITAFARC